MKKLFSLLILTSSIIVSSTVKSNTYTQQEIENIEFIKKLYDYFQYSLTSEKITDFFDESFTSIKNGKKISFKEYAQFLITITEENKHLRIKSFDVITAKNDSVFISYTVTVTKKDSSTISHHVTAIWKIKDGKAVECVGTVAPMQY